MNEGKLDLLSLLRDRLSELRIPEIKVNLKRNWYFPISSMAFFCLNATSSISYFLGLPITFMISLIIASQIPSMWGVTTKNSLWVRIIAILTAIGVCWGVKTTFSIRIESLESTLPISLDILEIASIFSAVAAIFFVYFFVLIFWKKMIKLVADIGVFQDIKAVEAIFYGVLVLVSVILVTVSFARTDAFYGTNYSVNIIYTSDSPLLVKRICYLSLTHPENDLRQPLFAVFSAPFVGIPYLLGRLFQASASVQAMLMDYIQILMLFTANYILAKMMGLGSTKRICFMLLACCTYTYLLFILMMEQYIVTYFWLILCLYIICERKQSSCFALWGAGGTLMTSMVLLPFMSRQSPLKNIKAWFSDVIKYGFGFAVMMLGFCRFDVFFNFVGRVKFLTQYSGQGVPLADKFFQYTEFIRNCFLAPAAGAAPSETAQLSWQLDTVSSVNFAGVLILLLSLVSAILNRDKRSSLFAVGWAGFSAVMLLVLGWGTAENGLILYSLYFGWAFLVLLFQLFEKIERTLNVTFLLPVLSIGCAVILAVINIDAIMDMVNFAATYFPL